MQYRTIEIDAIQRSPYDADQYDAVPTCSAVSYDGDRYKPLYQYLYRVFVVSRLCIQYSPCISTCLRIASLYRVFEYSTADSLEQIRFVDEQYLLELERIRFVDAWPYRINDN